jgi:hypothetical protein
LLGKLHDEVSGELAKEKATQEEYAEWCRSEQQEKGYAIETAQGDIERFTATIEEASARVQQCSADLDSLSQLQAEKDEELKKAGDVRSSENKDFQAAERELVESIDMLGRAATIIKRETGSFIQKKSGKKFALLSNAISKVVDAAWMTDSNRRVLQSLLQSNSEEEFSLKQPQASTSAYDSKSGGIVDTLEDMQDKAEQQLATLRREEMQKKHAYEMLAQSLSDQLKVAKKEAAEAQSCKAAGAESLAQGQGDLASATTAHAAETKALADLVNECKSKAQAWDARASSGAAELDALAKAQEILSGKFSFAQVAVAIKRSSESDESRDRAVALLKKLSRSYHSYGLMQVASSAMSDPFGKVRGLINDMLAKLEKQAQEEATHNAFCTEELKKSNEKKESKTAEVDKYQTRLDKGNAKVAELTERVSELRSELADLQAGAKEALNLRQEENGNFKSTEKDYDESATALAQAIQVLSEYYSGAAASAKSDAASPIIAILENAEADFTKGLAEIRAAEEEAVAAYEKFEGDNRVARKATEVEIKGAESEKKQVKVAIDDHQKDHETASKELDAIHEYLDKLRPQCESKAMTYEERKARRDAEIEGLKSALEILAADAGEALVQKRAFLSRK